MTSSPGDTPEISSNFDVTNFASQFQKFIDTMSEAAEVPESGQLEKALAEHLGADPNFLNPVRQEFAEWRWADIDLALDSLATDQDIRGIVPSDEAGGISDLVSSHYARFHSGAIERRAVPSGSSEVRHVVTNGLRLLEVDGNPVAIFASEQDSHRARARQIVVDVLSPDESLSRWVLGLIDSESQQNSVVRGKIVSFVSDEFGESLGIEFHPRPEIARADLILPEGTLERIEASVLDLSHNAAELRAVGQHLSRGILLYGPPGTGKTHTVRYLIAQAIDATVILLHGEALSKIRQAANAARTLGRTIIVLEDADLVAADRDFSEGERSVLFDLLDILDGLDNDADIAFVLTTNRVDVLEEAIALRPGRIDLAVEIPLPTVELRRRLFAHYARQLDVTEEGIATAADLSEGTTGSFAKEATRRTVVSALAANEQVDDSHLVAAVDELVGESADLRAAMKLSASGDEFDEDPDDDFVDIFDDED